MSDVQILTMFPNCYSRNISSGRTCYDCGYNDFTFSQEAEKANNMQKELVEKSIDIDSKITKLVNKNFWKLI